MARKLVMVTVLFAALAYLLYDHIPEGYSTSSSMQLRFIQAGVNAGRFLWTSADALGLVPGYKISRVFCRASRWVTPQPTDEVVRWYETVFDGVPVRVYEPRERRGVLPGFVYYHGGGFTICDLDSHHAIVHQLATLTNTVVISVDYRLAPEHPFPAAHDDCTTATKYFINNARKYNVDPKRIAIGGDSAGGNLAATVSLRLRDEHFNPSIKVQVLIYPTVQLIDLMLPSAFQNEHGIVLSRKDMKYFSTIYVSGHSKYADAFANNAHVPLTIRKDLSNTHLSLKKLPTKYTTGFKRPEPQEPDNELWDEIKSTILNPYLCPLIAQNSTGLPLTYIYTGEHDPLRDEGFLYTKKLKEAGNKVEHFHHDVGFHGIFQFGLYWPETQLAFKHMVDYILKHL